MVGRRPAERGLTCLPGSAAMGPCTTSQCDVTPPLTLLSVEDDQPIVELLSMLVAPLGVNLISATTGTEAIAMLDELHPAVVTLDLVLPDIDGYAVLEYIRKRPE